MAAGTADLDDLIALAVRRATQDKLSGDVEIKISFRDGVRQGRAKLRCEGVIEVDASAGATLKK